MKEKVCYCCHSIVDVYVDVYWQITVRKYKNWSQKLKNAQKLGLKYAKRVESMWKNETQQQKQYS